MTEPKLRHISGFALYDLIFDVFANQVVDRSCTEVRFEVLSELLQTVCVNAVRQLCADCRLFGSDSVALSFVYVLHDFNVRIFRDAVEGIPLLKAVQKLRVEPAFHLGHVDFSALVCACTTETDSSLYFLVACVCGCDEDSL